MRQPIDPVRVIVLDIEGTTTPIAFVYEKLFPYARNELPRYLDTHGELPECQPMISRLREDHDADARNAVDVPPWRDSTIEARNQSIVRYVAWLMDRDRKSTALKELQGRIWEQGYLTGRLVGEVFDDVAPALRRWQEHGSGAGIFSSGSVLAQKLLFRHSSAGDLTPLLRWHFDTTVGAKTDADSYRRIAAALDTPSSGILFVSDNVTELDAARAAGLRTVLCERPGNALPPAHDHPVIRTLDEVSF